ncbi:MAG: type II toxin-antitoxin system HicB family antitoxin [Candidatus Thiodiazotropha sp. (ex Troendleina suluensis)]|nr:type II toxin-antitoxin system HicB family antitoxin [Candidatus Thiodiazotropha sp. (ex Troendleina suluensis)]
MRYPIVIEPGDDDHAYGVVVPDLPGCFSAGDTLDEAIELAQEAILLHLEGVLDAGKEIPQSSSIKQLKKAQAYDDWVWALADVDLSEIQGPSVRVNVTVPTRALRWIDKAAKSAGESRSGFLVRAAMEKVDSRHEK